MFEETKNVATAIKMAKERTREGVPCHPLMKGGKIGVEYDCVPPEILPAEDFLLTLEEAAEVSK